MCYLKIKSVHIIKLIKKCIIHCFSKIINVFFYNTLFEHFQDFTLDIGNKVMNEKKKVFKKTKTLINLM